MLVDGFAGPGRYKEGEEGSPLIMLHLLASHPVLERIPDVRFVCLFIEQDSRRVAYLEQEAAKVTLPANVEVIIKEGRFEEVFSGLVEGITNGRSLIPTFAFIDPFGYTGASMTLTGRFLDFKRSEALFFLPLSYINRFVGRDGQATALNALFETEEWQELVPLSGDGRKLALLKLFETQLRRQGQVRHVISFELRTLDGNDYRLVFATQHPTGLKLMKNAMWSVDPHQGTRYIATRTGSGQEVLFQPQPDTGPLLEALRNIFGSRWFSVAEAVQALDTDALPWCAEKHLRRLTLVPAEKNDLIEVCRPNGRRAGTFTEDVRVRFKGDGDGLDSPRS
jgi:three-Cys-motif partner protein